MKSDRPIIWRSPKGGEGVVSGSNDRCWIRLLGSSDAPCGRFAFTSPRFIPHSQAPQVLRVGSISHPGGGPSWSWVGTPGDSDGDTEAPEFGHRVPVVGAQTNMLHMWCDSHSGQQKTAPQITGKLLAFYARFPAPRATDSGAGMWTKENRARYDRSQLRYESDLTDAEWAEVGPLIPPAKSGGNKRTVDIRQVVNGVMYILSTGCQWRAIPKDLPPRSTVHDYLERWSWDGTLGRMHHALYVKCREQASREASPTAAVIDAQSVKSAEKGGPRSIRTAMMRARRSRARSGISGRYPRPAATGHRDCGGYPGPRWRRDAAGHVVRDVSIFAEALCRRWLSGAAVSASTQTCPVEGGSGDRQTF
jgi:transposase